MMNHQKKAEEKAFWNKTARERIYAAFDVEEYEYIFERTLNDTLGHFIVDIGCASGVSSVLLARRGYRVIGFDLSPELIQQAQRLWVDEPNCPVFLVGDAENLPLNNDSCDVISCNNCTINFF